MPTSEYRHRLPLIGEQAARVSPRELVVVSGKGGTGKTSVLASFAVLAEGAVLADCDVDAADLHLLLPPRIRNRHQLYAGHRAAIRHHDCDGCGECLVLCRFDAIEVQTGSAQIDPITCEGCGVCAHFCPLQAIDMVESACGEWFVSDTRCGPMVHARLGIAAESSGKLVTTVRGEARRIAAESGSELVLIDGPPGIGCPVIASLAGATAALVVTEPSCSGVHDLQRVLALARHFSIPTAVCVNTWDLNPEASAQIEQTADAARVPVLGRICYDPVVTTAQIGARTVVEQGGRAAEEIRSLWHEVRHTWLPLFSPHENTSREPGPEHEQSLPTGS